MTNKEDLSYYERNKEKVKEKRKKYYEENKKKVLKRTSKYRKQNKEKIKGSQKKHYEENKDKIRERQKKYHAKNKEAIGEKQKKYYKKNKEKIQEYKKDYAQKNKEKIKEYKQEHYKKNRSNIRTKQNEEYSKDEKKRIRARERAKIWRENNPEKYKQYIIDNKEQIKKTRRKYYEKRAKFVNDYKKDKCCKKCGYNEHTEILQFHHTKKDKEFSIGSAIGNKSDEIIKKEMDKCILLCPNCHFLLHSRKQNRLKFLELENDK